MPRKKGPDPTSDANPTSDGKRRQKPKERANGEGSVYQRSDGVWVAAVSLGKDAKGNRRRVVGYGKTRKAAVAEKNKLLVDAQKGQLVMPRRETIEQYLKTWLTNQTGRLEQKTWDGYESHIRLHINPFLGRLRLAQLSPLHLNELYAQLLASGLSQRTVHHTHAVIRSALQPAVKAGILPQNPAALADAPRPTMKPPEDILDLEQSKRLLDALEKERWGVMLMLTLLTGLRAGEVTGLRWRDISVEFGELVVQQTVTWPKGGPQFKPWPKNRKVRRVSFPLSLLPFLSAHQERQNVERSLAGVAWEDNDLIFPKEDGRPMRRERALRILRSILKTCGLPVKMRTHDLRHTAASLMLALGTPLKEVQEMMGHSTGQITIDLYGHLLPGAQRAAAQRMDNALFERPIPQVLAEHSPRH